MMMAVVERDLNQPGAVGLAFHRMRAGIPIIKIAEEVHTVGVRRVTDEVDGLGHFFGGITVWLVVKWRI